MDGLECSEKKYSDIIINKDRRIDSQFWTTLIACSNHYKYKRIGDLLVRSQYGISIDMNEDGIGYPIYRMNEIHNMLNDLNVKKYANLSCADLNIYKLKQGDVLFNRTNSFEWVGRTGIYYGENITNDVFASYLVRFNTNEELLLPECLTAFLNTKDGVRQIKARARQSINQTNVNPEEVKEILMPIFSMVFQKGIRAGFVQAHSFRVTSASKYKQAEQLMSKHLGCDSQLNLQYAKNSEIKLSDSFFKSGRLDAEYYQLKYETIVTALNTKNCVGSLCDIFDGNFVPSINEKYKYIELANVGNDGNISNVEEIIGKELPGRARRIVREGQVIISSIEGSLGSCALVTNEYDYALCSTGFFVVSSSKINPETLLMLFKSMPIQALLKQRCSGTILTAISKDALLKMPLPMIDDDIQEQIQSLVQASLSLRRKSKQLLDNAVKAVEMAIETDEFTALAWLKTQQIGE